jgi:hypothetical protein
VKRPLAQRRPEENQKEFVDYGYDTTEKHRKEVEEERDAQDRPQVDEIAQRREQVAQVQEHGEEVRSPAQVRRARRCFETGSPTGWSRFAHVTRNMN